MQGFLFIVGLFFYSVQLMSQSFGTLTLHGKIISDNRTLSGVEIEVYQNNEPLQSEVNLRNGAFTLKLDLGAVYNISFCKDGFVSKSVAVIAGVDTTKKIIGRFFFQLDVNLYKENEERDSEIILPPVAKLYIIDQNEGFKYDKNYVRWVAGYFED